MDSVLNIKILKKLEELTENVNELQMCTKILKFENLHSNDPEFEFKGQFKKYLETYFPYEENS